MWIAHLIGGCPKWGLLAGLIFKREKEAEKEEEVRQAQMEDQDKLEQPRQASGLGKKPSLAQEERG